MKTVGEVLKEARLRQEITLEKLSGMTRIKKSFIQNIEHERWDRLPEFPVVIGFAKNLSSSLGLDREKIVALLRRDYPPQKLSINPKPDLVREFKFGPRLTFSVSIIAILLLIVGYLFFQYRSFINPPGLFVETPTENQIVVKDTLIVSGKTDSGSVVMINNQPVLVDDEGNFNSEVEITGDTETITIKAVSRSGKEAVVVRKIEIQK